MLLGQAEDAGLKVLERDLQWKGGGVWAVSKLHLRQQWPGHVAGGLPPLTEPDPVESMVAIISSMSLGSYFSPSLSIIIRSSSLPMEPLLRNEVAVL